MTKRDFIKAAFASGITLAFASNARSELIDNKIERIITRKNKMESSKLNPTLLEIIKDATRAPSGHNTQPWKFKVSDNKISIIPDYMKHLKIVDPDDHALFISLGCALENLLLSASAHQYDTKVEMKFKGNDDEIQVQLIPDTGVRKNPLYDFISTRQSTRSEYEPEAIAPADLEQLKVSSECDGVEIIMLTSKQQIDKLRPFIIEGSDRQFNNKAFVNELVSWIRFNERTARSKGDGLWAPCTGSPNVPKFIGRMAVKNFTSAKSEAKRWNHLIENSAGFALFVARNNSKINWIQLGRSFQRFGLKATQLNIKHAHANMPCEELEVRQQLISALNLGNRHPLLLVRFGYGEPMPYSFRRPVEEVLL